MSEAEQLAASCRASMIAAAGFGKTEIVARAVAHRQRHRALVLTHTHAGVDALRARLRRIGAAHHGYEVSTIASWALRLGTHYPTATGATTDTPQDGDWDALYGGVARLLRVRAIREALLASYAGGAYVDEYQDCSLAQHTLISSLSDVLPCRIVGDPLQGIFNFRGPTVAWAVHVSPTFPDLPGPTEPRRWEKTNPRLGEWLQTARDRIERGRPLRIDPRAVTWIPPTDDAYAARVDARACRSPRASARDSVVAVVRWPQEAHQLARRLNGQFSCIEPVEADDLLGASRAIDGARGCRQATAVLDFACTCMVGLRTRLKSIYDAFGSDREPLLARKNLRQRDALLRVAREGSVTAVLGAIDSLQAVPSVFVHRRELLHEMREALRTLVEGQYESLYAAARAARDRTRIVGRRFPLRAVGTTLLVKGQEFDHAVVLHPERMDVRNLYVAITRARKSLTIVSPTTEIVPAER